MPEQSPRPHERRSASVWRSSLAGLGILLLIISVPVAILTPFPFLPIGLGIGVAGAALAARNSAQARLWMAGKLKQHARLNRMTPDWLKALILGDGDA